MRALLFKIGSFKIVTALFVVLLATGCATKQAYDYTAYKQIRPRSILVLPPVNNSPDVQATYSVLSQATHPLAEAGYYVFPVTLVDETFKNNGLSTPADIHAVAPKKLQEIFGADAALYITITQYGSSYTVLSSAAIVAANAKLLDLKTGTLLWQGSARASNDENRNQNNGGLAGLLIAAIVNQIANQVTDASHSVAGITNQRLLSAGHPNGILYGPRSPKYQTD